ncbi:hypothetical protein, partial [Pseudomonas profundi]|uniref:hypothetical protein n=1 Tax=Pseudomonas profundi TaxID=1981513 RepID=UPI001CC23F98
FGFGPVGKPYKARSERRTVAAIWPIGQPNFASPLGPSSEQPRPSQTPPKSNLAHQYSAPTQRLNITVCQLTA